mgnify:CR=1 FL=1
MTSSEIPLSIEKENTNKMFSYINQYNIDLFGIADLNEFKNNTSTISPFINNVMESFKYAIVIGAQYGKLGKKVGGNDTSMFLEKVAFELMLHLIEKEKHSALIIHTEDEFDPINRLGLLSLKALAKAAGIGWQGRSLLIVSPKYGPIHRSIAVLTDMPLIANNTLKNECGNCFLCVDKCPTDALKYSKFEDHPERREDVLDIAKCNGDNGCKVCIVVCPWLKKK